MSKKLFLVSLLVFFGLGIGTLSAGPPKPKAQKPARVIIDIAVVDISSTGPTGTPMNSPIITIQNKGTKNISQYLEYIVKQNGQEVLGGRSNISLIPGQKFVIKFEGAASANFARPGDIIEATIDTKNELKEDNESNNTMSKKIVFNFNPPPPQPQPRPVYDIAISDMWLDSSCCLCAKFENKGNTSIKGDIKGDVWFDTNQVKYFILMNFSLPPGQTYIWKGGSQFQFTGSHSVRITIDSNHQIAESDENNNTMNKSFTCQLPDLTVNIWKHKVKDDVKANGKPCEWVNVTVKIKNESSAKAGAFKVEMKFCEWISPMYHCHSKWLDVKSLPGGQTIDYFLGQFNNCEYESYFFQAIVDVNNTVKESNESNNHYSVQHPVQPGHK